MGDYAAARTITLAGPTKSHNIAGIGGGFAFTLDATFSQELKDRVGYRLGGARAIQQAAMVAAYRVDSPWLRSTLARIRTARDRITATVATTAPSVRFTKPEATYFLWLDFAGMAKDIDAAEEIRVRCRLGGLPGPDFGARATHVRLAYATHGQVVDEVVERLAAGLAQDDNSLAVSTTSRTPTHR
jgi:bifunctional pyridoxal-dependent enzyme with beta-cystathionase and maltose regulon repressor activities